MNAMKAQAVCVGADGKRARGPFTAGSRTRGRRVGRWVLPEPIPCNWLLPDLLQNRGPVLLPTTT